MAGARHCGRDAFSRVVKLVGTKLLSCRSGIRTPSPLSRQQSQHFEEAPPESGFEGFSVPQQQRQQEFAGTGAASPVHGLAQPGQQTHAQQPRQLAEVGGLPTRVARVSPDLASQLPPRPQGLSFFTQCSQLAIAVLSILGSREFYRQPCESPFLGRHL